MGADKQIKKYTGYPPVKSQTPPWQACKKIMCKGKPFRADAIKELKKKFEWLSDEQAHRAYEQAMDDLKREGQGLDSEVIKALTVRELLSGVSSIADKAGEEEIKPYDVAQLRKAQLEYHKTILGISGVSTEAKKQVEIYGELTTSATEKAITAVAVNIFGHGIAGNTDDDSKIIDGEVVADSQALPERTEREELMEEAKIAAQNRKHKEDGTGTKRNTDDT